MLLFFFSRPKSDRGRKEGELEANIQLGAFAGAGDPKVGIFRGFFGFGVIFIEEAYLGAFCGLGFQSDFGLWHGFYGHF